MTEWTYFLTLLRKADLEKGDLLRMKCPKTSLDELSGPAAPEQAFNKQQQHIEAGRAARCQAISKEANISL